MSFASLKFNRQKIYDLCVLFVMIIMKSRSFNITEDSADNIRIYVEKNRNPFCAESKEKIIEYQVSPDTPNLYLNSRYPYPIGYTNFPYIHKLNSTFYIQVAPVRIELLTV